MNKIHPVIMAGGSGTRLWPLSRTQYPKQFLSLHTENSLIQDTVNRLPASKRISLICNEEHRFLAAEHMRQLDQACDIFLEPEGRNTAPAIALVALQAVAKGEGDQCLLILAADHVIENVAAFQQVVSQAEKHASEGQLVTFGIVPNRPETGYGYIQKGAAVDNDVAAVQRFVEKPNRATAEHYLASGEYLWNSGMFMFRADTYLQELEKFRPDILSACQQAMSDVTPDLDFLRVDKEAFLACPDESIDYAVMEKTDNAVVIPLDAGWSDLGSWDVIWDLGEKDEHGNHCKGETIAYDTKNSLLYADERLLTTLGVEDIVVIDTKDALIVAAKDRLQDIKKVVAEIKQQGRSEHYQHREIYRPWGKYDSVDSCERFQVKRITVKPGAKLSVQMHHHRAEHWVVVAGTAKVVIDGEERFITENESVYIPVTAVHSLENPGIVPLELIEVQVGAYLGEDDIVRFEDKYGRA